MWKYNITSLSSNIPEFLNDLGCEPEAEASEDEIEFELR
jgi:hypothetical protein